MSLSCLRLLWGHSWSCVFRRSLAERRNELEILHRQLGPPPSKQGGAEDYLHGPKRVPHASISQADLLNGGASQGGSLLELPDKHAAKRSKSPFSLFKKVRNQFPEGLSALQEMSMGTPRDRASMIQYPMFTELKTQKTKKTSLTRSHWKRHQWEWIQMFYQAWRTKIQEPF